jgi:hypothetical protein
LNPNHIIERFGRAGVPETNISMLKDTFSFASRDKSPAQVVESFRHFYGPTMNAFEAAEKSGTATRLHEQLLKLAEAHNTTSDGSTSIPATFLRVTVRL